MFVDLSLSCHVEPSEEPGRLLVCVNTDGRPDCGVFAGRHAGLRGTEIEGKRMPTVEHGDWSGGGLEVFEISGLPTPGEGESLQFHFAVVSWRSHVYCQFPEGEELVVSASRTCWRINLRGVGLTIDPAKVAIPAP